MTLHDMHGLTLTGASETGRAAYEQALTELQCYRADPVATIDLAIAADPGFAMAHAMRAWLHLLGTEPAGFAIAEASYREATAHARTPREKGHAAAIAALLSGSWHEAGRILEDVTLADPHDGLALLAGHQIDFFSGDARMLRDRIARAMPAWDVGRPGYHSLLGMRAFGLEETGQFDLAERYGRQGVELEPRDGWSQHAVAHVLEMQNRSTEGIAWMGDGGAWAEGSFFAVHNWWHLALYHLELGQTDAVFDLLDSRILGSGLVTVIDLIDASAMLWRLHLRGIDVQGRWDGVADRWQQSGQPGLYAFNDVHMVMALIGAGRIAAAQEVACALSEAAHGSGDNARFSAMIGLPVAQGLLAFARRDYATCARHLRDIRGMSRHFGGSDAQRDVLDLTLIEAALRGGNGALARGLVAERAVSRHDSPLTGLFQRRAQSLPV
ncbi:tetratricopeptide repeat protein [Paracoccus aestuariivivens]|uniref:Tetratricopeptide repeat protein 38 n=1 Tax=Paracoccus aestuariivivens TaxID=1820333 RepID=A0A6L6J8L4_9RHOB|nr:tetratricopeptide repeat protein [Paracoccus aestuariivivens]MTH78422.1 tetratricopeptide repeat protein [Paracoccus aestuariivivens]